VGRTHTPPGQKCRDKARPLYGHPITERKRGGDVARLA